MFRSHPMQSNPSLYCRFALSSRHTRPVFASKLSLRSLSLNAAVFLAAFSLQKPAAAQGSLYTSLPAINGSDHYTVSGSNWVGSQTDGVSFGGTISDVEVSLTNNVGASTVDVALYSPSFTYLASEQIDVSGVGSGTGSSEVLGGTLSTPVTLAQEEAVVVVLSNPGAGSIGWNETSDGEFANTFYSSNAGASWGGDTDIQAAFQLDSAATPEPGALALLCGMASVGIALVRRRRRSTHASVA